MLSFNSCVGVVDCEFLLLRMLLLLACQMIPIELHFELWGLHVHRHGQLVVLLILLEENGRIVVINGTGRGREQGDVLGLLRGFDDCLIVSTGCQSGHWHSWLLGWSQQGCLIDIIL